MTIFRNKNNQAFGWNMKTEPSEKFQILKKSGCKQTNKRKQSFGGMTYVGVTLPCVLGNGGLAGVA